MNKKIYYNQADSRWASHKYPSPSLPNATIKSGGCGATSSAMIISSLTNKTIRPDTLGDIFVKKGIRVNGGTDTIKAAKYIHDTYNIEYKRLKDKDNNDLINHLANGYVAMVNVIGGSVFSTGGHIIFVCGYANGMLQVHDPYMYTNKFNTSSRKGKVTVSGNDIWISTSNWKNYAKANIIHVFKIPVEPVATNKYKIGQTLKAEFDVVVACDQGGIKIMVDSRGYQFWCAKGLLNEKHTKVLALVTVEGYNEITKCYQMIGFKNSIYETKFDCKEEFLTDKF